MKSAEPHQGYSHPTIQAKVLRSILNCVDLPQPSKEEMLGAEGLDFQELYGVSARIPFRSYLRVFEALAEAANQPSLGLDISVRMGPELVGATGYIFLHSPDLATGLRSFAKNVFSFQDATSLSLTTGEDPSAIYRITDEAMAPRRQDAEFSLGYVHAQIRSFLGPQYAPREVYFEHARQVRGDRHEVFFGCPVFFEQDVNALVFRKADMHKRSPSFDPNLVALLQHYIQILGSREYAVTTLTETVNQALSGMVERQDVGIAQVAARLGMSEAVLRRRLRQEKANFRDILRSKRMGIAKRHLSETGMNILQVAQKVGYAETASFTRAFVAETGLTPTEFRTAAQSDFVVRSAELR